jgi:glycosyltransferase involved in cell wall biosynthesis
MHVLIIPSEHFVTPEYPTGGIFQLDQARALRAAGHKVGVINPGVISPRFLLKSYAYPRHEVIAGIPVYRRYERKLGLQRMTSARTLVETRERLGKELFDEYVSAHGKPEVIHAHDVLFAGGVARALHFESKVPYVITEHSNMYASAVDPLMIQVSRTNAATAAVLTAVSPYLGALMADHLSIRAGHIQTLPNVLGADFHQPSAHLPIAQPPSRGTKVFLTVASLDENKDQNTLLQAFAERFRGTGHVLRIAGIGPLRSQLESTVDKLGLRPQVTFLGMLDRASVRQEMGRADCFVLSSRVETFGVVLIEALSCGVPVVATRSGGPDHIVREGDGQLVPAEDAAAMAAAMEEVVSNTDRYRPEHIRISCLQRFGPEAFVANVEAYYRQAMASMS